MPHTPDPYPSSPSFFTPKSDQTDDRVVPVHSKKFIAELLEKTAGEGPHLLRIDLKAGYKFAGGFC